MLKICSMTFSLESESDFLCHEDLFNSKIYMLYIEGIYHLQSKT